MPTPFDLMFNPEALKASGSPFGNMAQDISSLVQLISQVQGQPAPMQQQAALTTPNNPFSGLLPPPQPAPQVPLPQPDPRGRVAPGTSQGEPGLSQEGFDARFPQAGEINSGAEAMRDPKGTAKKFRDSVTQPERAMAQPIGYLWQDKQYSNAMKKGDRLDRPGPQKERTLEQMLAPNEDEKYARGKILLKDKMGIDTPLPSPFEKYDDGPTREQQKRDYDNRLDKPTAKDFKYYENEMEYGQIDKNYHQGGSNSDDAWDRAWQEMDKDPVARAKIQKINHQSYEHGDLDVIRDVETSPVLELMRRKALMHLAGDVVPLPINPGPNAGLPSGAAIISGQKQIRNGGSNVVPHPAREDWYRRVSDRLRA